MGSRSWWLCVHLMKKKLGQNLRRRKRWGMIRRLSIPICTYSWKQYTRCSVDNFIVNFCFIYTEIEKFAEITELLFFIRETFFQGWSPRDNCASEIWRFSVLFSYDSENTNNTSADQRCFRHDQLWFSLNQCCWAVISLALKSWVFSAERR